MPPVQRKDIPIAYFIKYTMDIHDEQELQEAVDYDEIRSYRDYILTVDQDSFMFTDKSELNLILYTRTRLVQAFRSRNVHPNGYERLTLYFGGADNYVDFMMTPENRMIMCEFFGGLDFYHETEDL